MLAAAHPYWFIYLTRRVTSHHHRVVVGFICIFKLQLQNNKLKNEGKIDTQRVKEHNLSTAYYIYTREAQGNINIRNR